MENISEQKDKLKQQYAHINGWGIDADPENEPTYPIKNYTGDDHKRLDYNRPPLQEKNGIEILHSNERPNLPGTYGTTVPPGGLSGKLRKFAFRFSESEYGHWLSLLMADRINAVEGILDDIKHGHFPDIIAERGWAAEWKYNRKALIQKITIGAAVASALILYLTRKRSYR